MEAKINNCLPVTYSKRPFSILDLSLGEVGEIPHPENVIVKANAVYIDFGAFCYSNRSNTQRGAGQPRSVDVSSFLPDRPEQIARVIKVFSLLVEGGQRIGTVGTSMGIFRQFINWADSAHYYDCLAGTEATLDAFRNWVAYVEERFRRREIQAMTAHQLQRQICRILEFMVGDSDFGRGIRIIGANQNACNVEPASQEDFSAALALNHALFTGLCDLVIGKEQFPFKLKMPQSLGWAESHLWIFPGITPFLAPQMWGGARENLSRGRWCYDYKNGRIATVDEISHHYRKTSSARGNARASIKQATARLRVANQNVRHRVRVNLAAFAKTAFLFLFLANTGCNLAVVSAIEADEEIDASTVNQTYRSIKFRAEGKIISVVLPASFMPTLRRYMELRKYILNHEECAYLFFTRGYHYSSSPPMPIRPQALEKHYDTLLRIHPALPKIGARKIRATVADYYRRGYDRSIAARVMGHSEEVADRNYLAGSPIDHKAELTDFLDHVARAANKQKIANDDALLHGLQKLEEGGRCTSFGRPKAIAIDAPMPDCRQGCLFCENRILISNEEDVRKVASAAFLMEQLISGPLSEIEFRPQIEKCTEDLDAIAAMKGCKELVTWVKRDVFINGNLTPYFADKYEMFLELGVL